MKKLSSFPQRKSSNCNIGSSVCENLNFLKSIAKTKSESKRKRILRLATTSELLSIVEIALNVIKGRFNLTSRQKNRLLPYADFIRKVGRARSERGARKILQSGGGIPISALITPIIIEAVSYLANKAINKE